MRNAKDTSQQASNVDDTGLTLKQRGFVAAFLQNGGNASAAYRSVYDATRMKDTTIGVAASKVLNNDKVQAVLNAHRAKASEAVSFGVADVLKELVDIVTADPGELTAHRRVCCRQCYGHDHKYQWRDRQEFVLALAARVDTNARAKKGHTRELPNDDGGYGYNQTLPPVQGCPHCFGEGFGEAWFADTRYLSPKGRKLFAGVEQTKDGLKIKTRNQDAALQTLAKALGMLKDGVEITMPGAQQPLPPAGVTISVPLDPADASRLYASIMKGTK